jgi:dienelactone hydrolase
MIKSSLLLVVLVFFSGNSIAATSDSQPHSVNFITKDSVNIVGLYQLPDNQANKLPLVLFIHQGGSSKKEWTQQPIWQSMVDQGYAVLAFDLRQHGESAIDKDDIVDLFNNPKRAPLDLLAALEFVRKDPRIDKKRIGILGASIGANLAVMAASVDKYQIKSVVAMSGKVEAAQNLSAEKNPLQPQNAFVIASEQEQEGLRKAWAKQWFDITQGHRKISIAPGQEHGSFILIKTPQLNQQIIEWFEKTL